MISPMQKMTEIQASQESHKKISDSFKFLSNVVFLHTSLSHMQKKYRIKNLLNETCNLHVYMIYVYNSSTKKC